MNESVDSRDILLNQLADDFVARHRAGERPRTDDYTERHPDLADDIRSLFPALLELERAKAAGASEWPGLVSEALPLTQLGDFRLLREIGRGGMGVVYEAEQVSLGRRVAIKLLPPSVFREPNKRLRFEREAKSAAKLHHSNIVPVHGIGEHDGTPYYVMQFIPGLGLDAVIEELRRRPGSSAGPGPANSPGPEKLSAAIARSLTGELTADERPAAKGADPISPGTVGSSASRSHSGVPLPGSPISSWDGASSQSSNYWESVARIGVQVAGALSYAHRLGILHRDIKPANLLLDLDAVVWVTDFGLAKADDHSDDLTHTGDLVGTLRYMPPEAFEGKSDARSDVYAVGLTLFELVALRPAYDERDRNKLVKELTVGAPPRLRTFRREAPRDLVTIIEKSCDRNPARRYQSAAALAVDLQLFLEGRPIIARRPSDVERVWMWSRRRPATAGLVAALLFCLLIGTAVSTRFAFQAQQYSRDALARERDANAARDAANGARMAELSQRQIAEREKSRADILLTDMYTSRAILAGERQAAAEAALWSAGAAEKSALAGDVGREDFNRLRSRNWLRHATIPVASLMVPVNVEQLDVQPRGDWILLRYDKRLMLWSWREDRRLNWAETLTGVISARFGPDGTAIAIGFESGEAQIRETLTGRIRDTIPPGQVFILNFSPDGAFLVLSGEVIRIWDVERHTFLNPGCQLPQGLKSVAFNRAGNRLVTAGFDHRSRVFAVERGAARKEPLFDAVPHHLLSAPVLIDQDRTIVTMTESGAIARWDMITGKSLGPPVMPSSTSVTSMVGSGDGKWLVLNGLSGPEVIAADGRTPSRLLDHTNSVQQSAFSPDGTWLLTTSWDQTARLWSFPAGAPLGPPLRHMAIVDHGLWFHDNRHFVTLQTDRLLRVWCHPEVDEVLARVGSWGKLMRSRVCVDGKLAVPGVWHESPMDSQSGTKLLRVVNTETGKPAGPEIVLSGELVDSCLCSDNRSVAAVFERKGQGLFGIWDMTSGAARFEAVRLPGVPLSVAARPNRNQVAVLCSSGELIVFDDTTGNVFRNRKLEPSVDPPGRANQVQYTPDGQSLVALKIQEPCCLEVRDAETADLRYPPLRPTVKECHFHSFACSADGRYVATMALVNNHVQVWDLRTGRPASELLPHPGDFWGIFSVRFSPDGRFVLTSHKDGQMRYWNWRDAKLACPAMVHDNEVMDAAFTSDGTVAIAAVRGRPELHLWDLTTGRRIAPPIRLTRDTNVSALSLDLSPDGCRAFVTFLPSDLAVVNLENVLLRPTTSTRDMALLAELATSRQIELGDLSGLTTNQWYGRWIQFRNRNTNRFDQ